jgi:hypothetical protein
LLSMDKPTPFFVHSKDKNTHLFVAIRSLTIKRFFYLNVSEHIHKNPLLKKGFLFLVFLCVYSQKPRQLCVSTKLELKHIVQVCAF